MESELRCLCYKRKKPETSCCFEKKESCFPIDECHFGDHHCHCDEKEKKW